MVDGEQRTVPRALAEFLAAATHEDLVELSSQIRDMIDNLKSGSCPSCGAPSYIYRNDDKHFEYKADCPVARFRPMVRKFLPQSRR